MPVQVHPIALAATFLATGPGTPKQKLILGGKLIWAARTYPGDWTPDLLEKANSIYRGLLKGGTLQKAVEQMDENTANKCLQQLAKDTAELAAETEQARPRHVYASDPPISLPTTVASYARLQAAQYLPVGHQYDKNTQIQTGTFRPGGTKKSRRQCVQ